MNEGRSGFELRQALKYKDRILH